MAKARADEAPDGCSHGRNRIEIISKSTSSVACHQLGNRAGRLRSRQVPVVGQLAMPQTALASAPCSCSPSHLALGIRPCDWSPNAPWGSPSSYRPVPECRSASRQGRRQHPLPDFQRRRRAPATALQTLESLAEGRADYRRTSPDPRQSLAGARFKQAACSSPAEAPGDPQACCWARRAGLTPSNLEQFRHLDATGGATPGPATAAAHGLLTRYWPRQAGWEPLQ